MASGQRPADVLPRGVGGVGQRLPQPGHLRRTAAGEDHRHAAGRDAAPQRYGQLSHVGRDPGDIEDVGVGRRGPHLLERVAGVERVEEHVVPQRAQRSDALLRLHRPQVEQTNALHG